jgi:hypothetical protein
MPTPDHLAELTASLLALHDSGPVRRAVAPAGCAARALDGLLVLVVPPGTDLDGCLDQVWTAWVDHVPAPPALVALTDGEELWVYALEIDPVRPRAHGRLDQAELQLPEPRWSRKRALKAVRSLHNQLGLEDTLAAVKAALGGAPSVEALVHLDWSEAPAGTLGELTEVLLTPKARSGAGVHFTLPVDVIRVLVPALARPLRASVQQGTGVASLQATTVLDPTVGGGAFLVLALVLLRSLSVAAGAPEPRLSAVAGIDRNPLFLGVTRAALARTGLSGSARLVVGDALEVSWPPATVVVGNPPFVSKNKRQASMSRADIDRLRRAWPDIPGQADLCVYFLRRAHAELPPGGRAAFIATNTIRQNASLRGGLRAIVRDQGAVTEAVSGMPWAGAAGVRVTLVSWVRGPSEGNCVLFDERAGTWTRRTLDRIAPSLSGSACTAELSFLPVNRKQTWCFQGVTPGHADFLVSQSQRSLWCASNPKAARYLPFYLTHAALLRGTPLQALVDLHPLGVEEAQALFPQLAEHLRQRVLPDRRARADAETLRARKARADGASCNRHHRRFAERWWWMSYPRPALKEHVARARRLLVGGRYARQLRLWFVDPSLRPADGLMIFALDDDYSFGVLQSSFHLAWFRARGSSLIDTPRYTASTVFQSFPWPQRPTQDSVLAVAVSAARMRGVASADREAALLQLDQAVRGAYGVSKHADPLEVLVAAHREANLPGAIGPGVPPGFHVPSSSDYLALARTNSDTWAIGVPSGSTERMPWVRNTTDGRAPSS